MKILTSSLLALILMFSCSGNNEAADSTELDSGSMMQSQELDTCLCNDLDVDTMGIHYYKEETYTGVCVEYFPGSEEKYLEENLLNGQVHGRVIYYDREGQVLLEEIYEEGVRKRSGDVDVLHCDCSELELVESNMQQVANRHVLDGIPYSGTCDKYYSDSDQIYMSVSYKDGLLNGRTIYYNRDGSTMLIEKYEIGELISTLH